MKNEQWKPAQGNMENEETKKKHQKIYIHI